MCVFDAVRMTATTNVDSLFLLTLHHRTRRPFDSSLLCESTLSIAAVTATSRFFPHFDLMGAASDKMRQIWRELAR